MEDDDKSHFLIYQVIEVTDEEGHLIDVYQNKGRFLYKYAGSFLENAGGGPWCGDNATVSSNTSAPDGESNRGGRGIGQDGSGTGAAFYPLFDDRLILPRPATRHPRCS
jgi:hypothetical protein